MSLFVKKPPIFHQHFDFFFPLGFFFRSHLLLFPGVEEGSMGKEEEKRQTGKKKEKKEQNK